MASQIEAPKATTSVKRCAKCGETKSAAAFHRQAKQRDGLHSYCKACAKAWATTNSTRISAACVKWRERNPEKVADINAKWATIRAKERGRLTKAAQYFSDRPGWARVVFRILIANTQREGHCYRSPALEEFYLKYAEDAWNA